MKLYIDVFLASQMSSINTILYYILYYIKTQGKGNSSSLTIPQIVIVCI